MIAALGFRGRYGRHHRAAQRRGNSTSPPAEHGNDLQLVASPRGGDDLLPGACFGSDEAPRPRDE